MTPFGARLYAAMHTRGPLCVGIDPHPSMLDAWGLPDTPAGLARFAHTVIEAVGGEVAVLKPQSAFFERFGSRGIAVLESTIEQARAAGAIVIADVKRGDIDSTATSYAQAYLNPASPLYCDAITVHPYLGLDSLEPFFDAANTYHGGIFVLALTSNSGGVTVQHARTNDGRTVAQWVLDEVAFRNRDVTPTGSFGVVVGATIGETNHTLSTVNGPILVPGIGAQGGTVHTLQTVFGPDLPVILPSVSRSVLRAGPVLSDLREAVTREKAACAAVLRSR